MKQILQNMASGQTIVTEAPAPSNSPGHLLGQKTCASAFVNSIRDGKDSPIPSNEIFEVARATIEAAEILRNQA